MRSVSLDSLYSASNAYQLVALLSKQITSNAYSKKDQERLQQLKILYVVNLKVREEDIPAFFILDEESKPKYLEINTPPETSISESFFSRYADHCIAGIKNYLFKRRSRTFRSGKKGDLTELFFFELLMYLSRIRTAIINQAEITELESRINYLNAVKYQKDSPLDFGNLSNNQDSKQAVLVRTINELTIALNKGKDELTKQDANQRLEQLHINVDHLSDLILVSLFSLMYSTVNPACSYYDSEMQRLHHQQEKTKSDEPILYQDFPQDKFLGSLVYGLWQKRNNANYRSLQTTPGNTKNLGLPEIFNDLQKQEWLTHLEKIQDLFFQFDDLYRLLIQAKSMAGMRGNLWAYGPIGGAVLRELLTCLQNCANDLSYLAHKLKEISIDATKTYKQKNRSKNNDPQLDAGVTLEKNMERVLSLVDTIKAETAQILGKITTWPKNADEAAKAIEREFFNKANDYFIRLGKTPIAIESTSEQPTSATIELIEEEKESLALWQASEIASSSEIKFSSTEPMKEKWYHWRFSQTARFNRLREALIKNQNEGDFKKCLAELDEALASAAIDSKDQAEIMQKYQNLRFIKRELLRSLNKNKPRWRLFPASLGWPFNAKTRASYDALTLLVKDEFERTRLRLLGKISQLQNNHLPWDFSSQSSKDLNALFTNSQARQEAFDRNHPQERFIAFLLNPALSKASAKLAVLAFRQRFSPDLHFFLVTEIKKQVDEIQVRALSNSLSDQDRTLLKNLKKIKPALPFSTDEPMAIRAGLLLDNPSLLSMLKTILTVNLTPGILDFYFRTVAKPSLQLAALSLLTEISIELHANPGSELAQYQLDILADPSISAYLFSEDCLKKFAELTKIASENKPPVDPETTSETSSSDTSERRASFAESTKHLDAQGLYARANSATSPDLRNRRSARAVHEISATKKS